MYENLIIISLIFFFSSSLQGMTGFGFSLLSVPFLALLLSPSVFVPILILYSIIINCSVIISALKEIEIKSLLYLFPLTFLGVPIGTYLLTHLPKAYLQILIGSILIIFVIYQLLDKFKLNTNSKIVYLTAGFFSGILGGSISMSGPPIIMLFSNQNRRKHNFRVNLAFYFLVLNIITLTSYMINGLIDKNVIQRSILYFLPMFIGVITGNLLSHKIPEKRFKKLTLLLMLIMGVLTLVTGINI